MHYNNCFAEFHGKETREHPKEFALLKLKTTQGHEIYKRDQMHVFCKIGQLWAGKYIRTTVVLILKAIYMYMVHYI